MLSAGPLAPIHAPPYPRACPCTTSHPHRPTRPLRPKNRCHQRCGNIQQFKAQHPGYVLFFRMGDFYEMFWEDAKVRGAGARRRGSTSRNKGSPDEIPMAGVPFHAVENYLRKMIAAGQKVAICEQTEDRVAGQGLVKREVVRLMTPGTLTDDAAARRSPATTT